ncbi:hypothetical protein E3V36_05675 [Candidatus Marinimicrobia bacterium MT.SAG.2]|nr:hypothetical protein E3V36_05675 [Candidatus Marinimicrobia bacterium MT.SAG.2]
MKLYDLLRAYANEALSEEIDLPDNRKFWPEEWLEEFEERSGIMEFDGDLDRMEAEQLAEDRIREQYKDEWLNKTQGNTVKIELNQKLKVEFNID